MFRGRRQGWSPRGLAPGNVNIVGEGVPSGQSFGATIVVYALGSWPATAIDLGGH